MFGFRETPSNQSHPSLGLSCIISHVIFGFAEIAVQFHGLSGVDFIFSHVMFGFSEIPFQSQFKLGLAYNLPCYIWIC